MAIAPATKIGMIATHGVNLDEYLRLIKEERYSAILDDYSLLSIELEIKKGEISRHRYIYIPCPIRRSVFDAKPEEIEVVDFLEQIDKNALIENLISQGFVRFDFTGDPVEQDIHHPISHMTFVSSDCRIALKSPISIGEFITFIFDNFHPHHIAGWLEHQPYLRKICDDTIRPSEVGRMHLYWAEEY